MSAFVVQLRRGPGRWMAPLLLIAGATYVGSRLETISVWADTTEAVADAPFLMGPLAAGIAAWAGARSRRRGTHHLEVLSVRPFAAAAVDVAALMVWAFAAYLLLATAIFVVTAATASWGGPSWTWLTASTAGLLVQVPIGWAAGRLLPFRFTPFGVALVAFTLVTWVDLVGYKWWWKRLFPAVVWVWIPFDEIWPTPMWGQVLWYAGLTAGIFAGVAFAYRDRLRTVVALAAIGSAGLVSGVALVSPEGSRFAAFGQHVVWTCEGGAPEICVHKAYESSLPELRRRAEEIAARLDGTPFEITRVEHRPRGGHGSAPTPGAVAFGFDAPTPRHFARASLEIASGAFDLGLTCFPDPQGPPRPGLRTIGMLVDWLSGRPVRPIGPDQAVAWDFLNRQDDAAMRQWLTKHAAEIRSCSISFSDVR